MQLSFLPPKGNKNKKTVNSSRIARRFVCFQQSVRVSLAGSFLRRTYPAQNLPFSLARSGIVSFFVRRVERNVDWTCTCVVEGCNREFCCYCREYCIPFEAFVFSLKRHKIFFNTKPISRILKLTNCLFNALSLFTPSLFSKQIRCLDRQGRPKTF